MPFGVQRGRQPVGRRHAKARVPVRSRRRKHRMGPPGAEHGRADYNGAAVGRYATPVYVLPYILKFRELLFLPFRALVV